MAFSTWSSRLNSSEHSRRTNSQGVSKVDCYTCQKRQRRCDRQRPQCGDCIETLRKCGGYAMDLVWKDQKSVVTLSGCDDDDSRTLFPAKSHDHQSPLSPRKRPLRFVQGRPKAMRKPKERCSEPATFSISRRHASSGRSNGDTPSESEHPGSESPVVGVPFTSRTQAPLASDTEALGQLSAPTNLSWTQDYHAIEKIAYLDGTVVTSCLTDDQASSTPQIVHEGADEDAVMYDENYMDHDEAHTGSLELTLEPFAMQMLYNKSSPRAFLFENQAQKFQALLAMYDEEFCILPLSMDCDDNPFRISQTQCETYPFLLHSVLALSFQHLAKKRNNPALMEETDHHRSTAVQLYSEALTNSSSTLLLDTLLLLFNFEVTQSAFSGWTVHLQGARKILDGMNIAYALRRSSRIRAQVATLIWWDITIALISRREARLPLRYLDVLIEQGQDDDWTFFALNGCPLELITAMGKLARLASIYEKAEQLEWTTFNTHPVDVIVDEVLHFKNDEDIPIQEIDDISDDPDARWDKFHCIEAWRYAIMLYTRRVFRAEQDAGGLRAIDHLTRITLDHIRCIRPIATVQKQVLLPLFLAAAELANEDSSRDFVRAYCKHWSAKARYSQFESALAWLETIWMDWATSTRSSYWWGCKVGGEHWGTRHDGYPSVGSELLLG